MASPENGTEHTRKVAEAERHADVLVQEYSNIYNIARETRNSNRAAKANAKEDNAIDLSPDNEGPTKMVSTERIKVEHVHQQKPPLTSAAPNFITNEGREYRGGGKASLPWLEQCLVARSPEEGLRSNIPDMPN